MGKKRILVVLESVAPVQSIAAVRWTKLVKYLSRFDDYDVSILTNQKGFDGKDGGLKQYAFDVTSEHDLDGVQVQFIHLSSYQVFANKLFNLISSKLSNERTRGEKGAARAEGRKNRALVRVLMLLQVAADWLTGDAIARDAFKAIGKCGKHDVVISTYGPRWPHRVASRLKKTRPGIKWIADFRDPAVSSRQSDNALARSYADEITKNANCVIGVSEGTIKNLFLKHNQRANVLTNGFDEEETASLDCRRATDKLRFVYTGTLYADDTCLRDIHPLFAALCELAAERKINLDNVIIEYAGTTPDLFLAVSKEYPDIAVQSHGLMRRSDVLDLQAGASCLVVCTWNTSWQQGVLTGKIFEYMRANVPIIGLCSGDIPSSDLRKLIEKCRLGICYEEADPASSAMLKEFIVRKYGQWKSDGQTSLDAEAVCLVKSYSYSVLARQLADIIECL